MIIEIRTYRLKPGERERFIEFFERKSGPVQQSKGIKLFGPFVDLQNENVVVYLRGFATAEERNRVRALFYDGSEWKGELKAEARRMLEHCDVVLAEATSCAFSFET
jgi:hypothetical protein